MENNKLMLLGAFGLVAYAMMGKKESEFLTPCCGWVKESNLNSLGYQKINGIWYSSAQINAAANQAGVPNGTVINPASSVFNTIATILATMQGLLPVVQSIVTLANRPQRIQEILNKYTVDTSAYYNAAFPYNQAQLQALSNNDLAKILDTGTL